jgi:Metalloenzyme superfamily
MKTICFLFLSVLSLLPAAAQPGVSSGNIFIITTDGFRWQEVFTGADSLLLNNEQYTGNPSFAKEMYWDANPEQRRKKLMPFLWNIVAKEGQLYGNRLLQNKVNVKNLYKISYPGYNEIFTGHADLRWMPNKPINNKNENILAYLNEQPAFAGKIAAFTSWDIFPYILQENKSGFPVNSGYEALPNDSNTINQTINLAQQMVVQKKHTRHDLLTYISAMEYIQANHPKVFFLGLGETDEEAHAGNYDKYLQKAAMFDKMIGDLYAYVQSDPVYKNNTTFIITTDHGRGKTGGSWNTHGFTTKGSGETWLAIIGSGIHALGEVKEEQQTYANQLAATIASLLGETFTSEHRTDKAMSLPVKVKDNAATVAGK